MNYYIITKMNSCTCLCGSRVGNNKAAKVAHEKTNKHKTYIGAIYTCDCGSIILDTTTSIKKHEKTKIHIKYLNSLNIKECNICMDKTICNDTKKTCSICNKDICYDCFTLLKSKKCPYCRSNYENESIHNGFMTLAPIATLYRYIDD